MVTEGNNNKFYEMTYDGVSSNFQVKYGRVESTSQNVSYPIHQWDKKYREKTAKGYVDITHTVSVKVETVNPQKAVELDKVQDSKVQQFLDLMQKYTKGLLTRTYTVQTKDVTKAQVDEAQKYIDNLKKIDQNDVTSLNSELLKLYMVIPRKMGNVRDYLIPSINLQSTLQQEQDNLDAMAAQVNIHKKEIAPEKPVKGAKKKKQTLLDMLGVDDIRVVTSTKEIDKLVRQITGKRTEAIFEVEKTSEKDRLDKWLEGQANKTTKFVYHGTKCASVIPILEQGLKIRPTGNFQFSGKAYGNGNYFSDHFSTSIDYTDVRYTGDGVLLVYEMHTGKESKSSFRDYSACKNAGYDSFEGGWLRVAYKEEQAKIKYIIWVK